MMKHEFDALVGIDTDPECYKKIEAVYMQFDEMFPTKEAIVSFYKKHDMNGIERMYREALKIQELKRQNELLTQQLKAISTPVVLMKQNADMEGLVEFLKRHDWVESHIQPYPEWRIQHQGQPVAPRDGRFDMGQLYRYLRDNPEHRDQMIEYAAKHSVTGQSLKSMMEDEL